MTHVELADLLNDDLAINIGQEVNSNRVHKLFYSTRDNICFVAIQDIKTGTVVTVLPIDYHENISWAVSIEAQNKAKGLVIMDEVIPPAIERLNTNATVFKFSGNVVDDYGRYEKTVSLGSWPCVPYEYSVDALIEDKEFVDFLGKKIKEKSDSLNNCFSFINTIIIRIGRSGEPVSFSTSEIMQSNVVTTHPPPIEARPPIRSYISDKKL